MASEKLMEATKNLDNPEVAFELVTGAKKELTRVPGNISKVLAVKAGVLALDVKNGGKKKDVLLKEILSLANEMKSKGL